MKTILLISLIISPAIVSGYLLHDRYNDAKMEQRVSVWLDSNLPNRIAYLCKKTGSRGIKSCAVMTINNDVYTIDCDSNTCIKRVYESVGL